MSKDRMPLRGRSWRQAVHDQAVNASEPVHVAVGLRRVFPFIVNLFAILTGME
jgi:hypothetical protein